MQLLLKGGSTGTHTVTTTPVTYPITAAVMALGVQDIGGLVEIPPGMSANLRAKLAYRYFADDDSQSAGTWSLVTGTVSGPGKSWIAGQPTGSGMRIQLGLELSMSSGTSVGRAWLRSPMLVSK